jgi:hypothetical protein
MKTYTVNKTITLKTVTFTKGETYTSNDINAIMEDFNLYDVAFYLYPVLDINNK